jgi:glucose/mannose transport system permease protein
MIILSLSGAFIAALPTIVVYLLLGKLFMRGLLAGSLKG